MVLPKYHLDKSAIMYFVTENEVEPKNGEQTQSTVLPSTLKYSTSKYCTRIQN